MAAVLLWLTLGAAAASLVANALALRVHLPRISGTRVSERPPAALVLRGLIAEWLATTLALMLWPCGILPLPSRSAAGSRGIVVLVPELGGNRAAFWLLRRRLRRRGWRTVDACARGWLARRELGRAALDADIRGAASEGAGAPLVVLAHGAGGLAARDCLRAAADSPVRQLVTLGTPHQGSTALIYRFVSRELNPEAERMRDLGAADPVAGRFDAIALSSRFDAWIVPPDAAYYPGAFNIAVDGIGHYRMLFSRKIWELIDENLPNGCGPALAPRGCQERGSSSSAASTRATSSASL